MVCVGFVCLLPAALTSAPPPPAAPSPQGACEGILVIKRPWPSIMRTVAGDHDRFEQTYFHMFKGRYFTGVCAGGVGGVSVRVFVCVWGGGRRWVSAWPIGTVWGDGGGWGKGDDSAWTTHAVILPYA